MDKKMDISSSGLHVLAMFLMLLDHLWATLLPSQVWMTCVGRIAFPIFAFLSAEGYRHTHNLKKYMGRLLLFAFLSEIPFDLMYGGAVFYPYHQNVLWTLLLGLCCMKLLDIIRSHFPLYGVIPLSALVITAAVLAATILAPDYYGPGILTILTFYFFHQKKWWSYLAQFLILYWLNVELLGGLYYPISILGFEFEMVQQGFALLALLPIWMYKGKQGYREKWFHRFCYWFYPAHCLILATLARL